ncbi:UNVERIFIED_CONTAM: hypothetical protein FKN15_017545 [Acipenser sinensis]
MGTATGHLVMCWEESLQSDHHPHQRPSLLKSLPRILNKSTPVTHLQSKNREENGQPLKEAKTLLYALQFFFFIVLILMLSLTTREVLDENCPDHNPALSSWNPGQDPQKTVIIRKGDLFRLDSPATVHAIIIQKGGVLVFADETEGFKNITLRTRYILIEDGGVLHIGAAKCRYRSKATITLFSRRDEGGRVLTECPSVQKHPREMARGDCNAIPKGSGVYSGGQGPLCRNDSNATLRLQAVLVKAMPSQGRMKHQESLYGYRLISRQAWALVGVIGSGNTSCSEDVREHENHDTGGQAVARREFITIDGVRFSVSAYSEWREGFPISGFQVEVVDGVMFHMKDDVQSWNPGDRINDSVGFFLEDGTEQRNTLYHNLGLVTKPATLLPTDRNKVYGNYIPVPATDCNMSTGDTHGLAPETKAELTPLGIFYNNRLNSNFKDLGSLVFGSAAQTRSWRAPIQSPLHLRIANHFATILYSVAAVPKAGLFIDKGVKTTNASAADPREYLCLDNNVSDGSFPKDIGSSQEVSESMFVGESKNYGTNGGQNKYWGVRGGENKTRTLPRNKTFLIRGFQIYDGPVHLTRSTFKHFVPTSDRYTSAVGFFLKNPRQLTPRNNISSVKFETSVFIQTWGSQNLSMSIVRDEYPSSPMTLRGINSQRAAFQQYQQVVMIGKSCTVHWNGSAPKETVLYLINLDK